MISREALVDIEEAEKTVICDGCGLERPAGQKCETCEFKVPEEAT